MTIRPKTKRRVLILLSGLMVFTGAIAWLYAYRMRVAESKLQPRRADRHAGLPGGGLPNGHQQAR